MLRQGASSGRDRSGSVSFHQQESGVLPNHLLTVRLDTVEGGYCRSMAMQKTIIWTIVALLFGVAIGFGFRAPISSALNLEAQTVNFILPSKKAMDALALIEGDHGCKPPKYWTGNGCADTSKWTGGDWEFFNNCIARLNPVTPEGVYNCVRQTELGRGRR